MYSPQEMRDAAEIARQWSDDSLVMRIKRIRDRTGAVMLAASDPQVTVLVLRLLAQRIENEPQRLLSKGGGES